MITKRTCRSARRKPEEAIEKLWEKTRKEVEAAEEICSLIVR